MMRTVIAVAVAVVCLAATARSATVFEIADDAGSVAIGNTLDTSLTRKSAGVLGAASLSVDNALNVSGTTTLGSSTTGPVLVRNNLNVAGTAQVNGQATLGVTVHNGAATFQSTTTLNGATTFASTATHNGATTFASTATLNGAVTVNGATTFSATSVPTFNALPYGAVVNTDLYVQGLIGTGMAGYRRSRLYGMSTKVYNPDPQNLYPKETSVLIMQSMSAPYGYGNAAHGMWRGVPNNPTPCSDYYICKQAQNGLSAATDGAGGPRIAGYYRLQGSVHVGGCAPAEGSPTPDSTWRSLQIALSVNSVNFGPWDFHAANMIRDYSCPTCGGPKEISLQVSDTFYMSGDMTAYLVFLSNCGGTISSAPIQTQLPPYPTSPQNGPRVTFSITYVGEP